MENLELEAYVPSRSNCRVGKITARKQAEENKLIEETDTKK